MKKMKDNNPALTFIKCRLPGGKFYDNIAHDISQKRYFRLMNDIFKFAVGERIVLSFCPQTGVERLGIYSKGDTLYHFTPKKNIESIRRQGILSPKGTVFLTDDINHLYDTGFLGWKAGKFGIDVSEFTALKIDAAALRRRRKIYNVNNEHEFVTEKVEPEYIMFD